MNRYSPVAAVPALLAALIVNLIPGGGRPTYARQVVMVPDGGRLDALDAQGRVRGACPLKHTDVDVAITGHFTRVTLTQQFHNPYPDKIEAVYTFPLSHRAAVDRMTMTIGDRVIEGEVKEREQARAIYEAARASGHIAGLLEQERPNIFTQSVANIEPGAEIDIMISYVELLESRDGTYSFEFPMVVGPRYIPGALPTPSGTLPAGYQRRSGVVLLGPARLTLGQEGDVSQLGTLQTGKLTALLHDAVPIEQPVNHSLVRDSHLAPTPAGNSSNQAGEREGIPAAGGARKDSRTRDRGTPHTGSEDAAHAAQQRVAHPGAAGVGNTKMRTEQASDSPTTTQPVAKQSAPPTLWYRFEATYCDGSKDLGEIYTNGTGHVNGRWFYVDPSRIKDMGTGFAPDTTQVPDASRITPEPVRPGMRAGHDISLAVTIDTGGPAIRELTSALHEVTQEHLSPSKTRLRLRNAGEIPNRDFVLTWKHASDKIEEATFTHTGRHGNFFTLILQPPERVADAAAVARELIFVLDTSGSMTGRPIEKAKAVMSKAIAALRPQDTFNLITFSGDTHILWEQPRPGTPDNIAAAQQFLASRQGRGGTEMMKAIEAALVQTRADRRPAALTPDELANLPADGRRVSVHLSASSIVDPVEHGGVAGIRLSDGVVIDVRQLPAVDATGRRELTLYGRWETLERRRVLVVESHAYGETAAGPIRICCFMTDGYVGNDMQIIDAVKKNARTTRVFSFGIGNSVNRYLLDGMARAGRGEVEYVLLESDADAAVERFARRIQTPVLTDIELTFSDGLKVQDLVPGQIADLFDVQPLVIHGRYTAPGQGTLTIRGNTGSGRYERVLELDLPAEQPEHDTIATLWARAKVEEVMNRDLAAAQRGHFPPDLRSQIVALGEQFQIMTQFTSFVAVEKARVTVGGQPRLVAVPIEMPEGVSYEGVFGGEGPGSEDHPQVSWYFAGDKEGEGAPALHLGRAVRNGSTWMGGRHPANAPARARGRGLSYGYQAPAAIVKSQSMPERAVVGGGGPGGFSGGNGGFGSGRLSGGMNGNWSRTYGRVGAPAKPNVYWISEVGAQNRPSSYAMTADGDGVPAEHLFGIVATRPADADARAGQPLLAQHVALAVAQRVRDGKLDEARRMADELAKAAPEFKIGLKMRDVLADASLPPAERDKRIAALADEARQALEAMQRDVKLRRRLDECLYQLATSPAEQPAPAGLTVVDDAVQVTLLLADVNAATLAALAQAGFQCEAVAAASRIVIGRAPRGKLTDIALLDGVRRVEPTRLEP